MLHLQTEILRDSNYCVVEYENPNLDITKNYTLRFHSVYSKPNEYGNKYVPLTFSIQDSPYASYFEYKDFQDKKIKKISTDISRQINHQNSYFKRYLKKFVPQTPTAKYDGNARDRDLSTRFFNLQLPKNTYLFSNYKPILHALGYAEDQLEYIQDLSSIGIPNNVIIGSQSKDSTNIESVWIVRNNPNDTSVYPAECEKGNLKWKKGDLFENVFFTSKKQDRYQQVRKKRQAAEEVALVSPQIQGQELQIIFNTSDSFTEQRNKVNKNSNWNRRAELIQVAAVNNFNWSELKGSADISVAQAKLNYWRRALVREVTRSTKLNEDVVISIPDTFFSIDGKKEIGEPLQFLLNDSKTYVRIAAAKTLYLYISKYIRVFEGLKSASSERDEIAVFDTEITAAQEGSRLIRRELDKFTKEGTDLVKKALESIDQAEQEKAQREQDEQRRREELDPQNPEGGDSNDPTENPTSGSADGSGVLPPAHTEDQENGPGENPEEGGRKRERDDNNQGIVDGGDTAGDENGPNNDEPPTKKQKENAMELKFDAYEVEAETLILTIEDSSTRALAAAQDAQMSTWDATRLETDINEKYNEIRWYTNQAKDAYDVLLTLLDNFTERTSLLAQDEISNIQTSATEAKAKLEKISEAKLKILQSNNVITKNNEILSVITTETNNRKQTLQQMLDEVELYKDDFTIIYNKLVAYKNRANAAVATITKSQNAINAHLYEISSARTNVLQKETDGTISADEAEKYAEDGQNLLDAKIRREGGVADGSDEVVDENGGGEEGVGGNGNSDQDLAGGGGGGGDGNGGGGDGNGGGNGGNGGGGGDDDAGDENGGGNGGEENGEDDGGGDDDDDVVPDVDMDDERNWPNFKLFNSCSVGIVHFANDIFVDDEIAILEVNEDTTPANIARQFNTFLPRILQSKYNLSLNFKANVNRTVPNDGEDNGIEEKTYSIQNLSRNTDSSAYIEFDFNSVRNGYLIRLTKSGLPTCKIKMNVNEQLEVKSDSFKIINPFKDSFKKNLPLIAMPVNAGLTNSFFSGIGMASSFGIIETNGKVKDAVSIYMRPAKKERFLIYFLTTENQDKYFDTPSLLYLHFVVEPLHV